ncbi:MAG: DNA translocase FtsK 4TM domain-containing protein [Ardenticatenaceae bacterium]|nr:DNA translocase FtsK 4TM domain-containing protein [Ardenticatenaceae bacterium]MCB9445152.1 DNA translocase FtsK 4TM domain-containing protein [Ardenticatenaceae bacterium]
MARSKSTKSTSSRSNKRQPTPPPPTWDEQLINRLMPWRMEIAATVVFILAIVTFLALPGWTSAGWLGWWTNLLRQTFGWGAYTLALSVAAASLHVGLRKVERPYHIRTNQVIGIELILLTALPLSHQLTGASLPDAYLGKGGGLVGWALSEPLRDFFGPFLTTLFYFSLLAYGTALVTGFGWNDLLNSLNTISLRLRLWSQRIAPIEVEEEEIVDIVGTATRLPQSNLPNEADETDELIIINDSAPDQPYQHRRDPRLPPLDILETGGVAALNQNEIDAKKQIIEQTLADFGLPAEVTEIRRGPAVTQFGVLPGYIDKPGPDGETRQQKVRIGQIASLQKDLTLALAAPRLRIQAPVPGRGVVGIEVPNDEISIVRLRPVIESESFYKLKSPLAAGLGRDVSGASISFDLAKLPHLLVAGTTGSGKSVCINAIISCLIFNNTPEDLNLVMIDPKKVELIRFNGVPHLIGRVETEADRAVGVLRWLTAEMDRRYEMFTQVGARNLGGYNRKIARRKDVKKLPHVAVFIDELADLMHTYPGDVERTLCRLAQMARATGIHLMVATQRPSTDVITGLIKANFPARLSFAVASGIDSRVILDTVGAEHLLGKGDLLFLPPDANAPMRIQGVFVNDLEIERIVNHWQKAMPDFEPAPAPWEDLIARHALLDETDSLLEQAIEIVQKQDYVSTSFLQRRLRVGYPRAARIMEHLYEMGLVEDPKAGGKTRRTNIDESVDDPLGDYLAQQDEED